MADGPFQVAARRRLNLTPLPPGAQVASHCQNTRPDGSKCNATLDADGHHAAICEIGGGLLRRHHACRDKMARCFAEDLAATCHAEQRAPQFDRVNADESVNEARLDIAVCCNGRSWLLDVTIVGAFSSDAGKQRQRAAKDGAAALAAEDAKRRRYPGPNVVPFAIESHGRIGPTGLAWLRTAYHGEPDALRKILYTISGTVQSHTAAMAMATYGAHL